MTIGSLFAGIGGLELGLERAGLGPTIWQVEQDAYCRSVLAKHWPDADRSVTDVCEAGAANLERVDLICGGFPCQDLSYAGKGAGLDGARSGLWFEYLRIIRELRPRFVVVENVAALLARGMDVVLGTLAESGYDALWTSLRASDVGAPHRRERLFIVAYPGCSVVQRRTDSRSLRDAEDSGAGEGVQRQRRWNSACDDGEALAYPGRRNGNGIANATSGDDGDGDSPGWAKGASRAGQCGKGVGLADPNGGGCEGERICGVLDRARGNDTHGRDSAQDLGDAGHTGPQWARCHRTSGQPITSVAEPTGQTQSRMGGATDGLSGWVDGRWPAGPHEPQEAWEAPRTVEGGAGRTARLKALGNAVVPQCAEVIGHVIWGLS